jgi:hypothetical protein
MAMIWMPLDLREGWLQTTWWYRYWSEEGLSARGDRQESFCQVLVQCQQGSQIGHLSRKRDYYFVSKILKTSSKNLRLS